MGLFEPESAIGKWPLFSDLTVHQSQGTSIIPFVCPEAVKKCANQDDLPDLSYRYVRQRTDMGECEAYIAYSPAGVDVLGSLSLSGVRFPRKRMAWK